MPNICLLSFFDIVQLILTQFKQRQMLTRQQKAKLSLPPIKRKPHEKMLNIINQENANQNHNEILPHTCQNGYYQKTRDNEYQ